MQNVNISNFRKDLFAYVNQTLDFSEVINVNTKKGNVIVLSEEEYNGMLETVNLLSNPTMRNILVDGMNASNDEFEEIDWKNELSN